MSINIYILPVLTIDNTDLKSDMKLCDVLNVLTKGEIVSIIRKLDGYISPNLKKADTAIRAVGMILEDPVPVLEDLGMDELKLVKEFVQAGPNTYVPRRMRRTPSSSRNTPWY